DRVLREPFGERPAADITPDEIARFIAGLKLSNATCNRYRAYFSLAYRLGMENGKVSTNPARLVRPWKEDNARLRFSSRDEYKTLLGIIQRDNPEQVPAFIVSVYAG